ncbi:GNAT family N-acetyltransferase [Gallaecimonas kandeliae]|uniref:GNAT family N-acetyltransferase n=1 Tax=Gallaecimonas kandeliae TaxID=3029055 RepID=UPI002647A267|nr:GNAT family N-acetyltransferase [Gallaecimonas kandeliae]WKE67130.1 GNAT family N-acetyltransferase [Gallaecimonas kandeliae]
MQNLKIRPATAYDCEAMADIYNGYVRDSVITFEEKEVTPTQMAARLAEVMGQNLPWLVAEGVEGLLGYAYATPWKSRSAYRFSLESTIYLDPLHAGKGVGKGLYGALLDQLRARHCHTVLAGIALPNPASIALHERLGFTQVGELKEVGFKQGRWVDVGYWQLRL